MKKIEINDELYKKLEETYANFRKNQDKIPPIIYKKYGDSFDTFVEKILFDFVENMKKSAEFTKSFGDLFSGLDLSKLKEELSSFSSLFSGLKPKEENKDRDEKSNDPEKTKN